MARKPLSEQGNTLQDIQDAAFALFARFGYDGVSMQKVAKAAGLTKAALYWHYENKDELYIDCLRRLFSLIGTHVFAGIQDQDRPMDRYLQLVEGLSDLVDDPSICQGVAGFWLPPGTSELPEARMVIAEFERTANQTLQKMINDGVSAGDFSADIPVEHMVTAIRGIIQCSLTSLGDASPDQIRYQLLVMAQTVFKAYGARAQSEPDFLRDHVSEAAADMMLQS